LSFLAFWRLRNYLLLLTTSNVKKEEIIDVIVVLFLALHIVET
jgi:hypothetical protein